MSRISEFNNGDIKNIIFDVGGILLGYRWKDMFKDHGTDSDIAYKIGTGIFDSPNWLKFDAGLITSKQLIDDYCIENPEFEEDARWFFNNAIQMRVLRPRVYEEVKRLKAKGYKIYILSNYSKELYELHTGDLSFRTLNDGEVVSYMIHSIKPDKSIYEYLLNTYSLNPEESLFFDDRLENVEGAVACGINGIHIADQDEELLIKYLKEFQGWC